jgi:hypothetical protein
MRSGLAVHAVRAGYIGELLLLPLSPWLPARLPKNSRILELFERPN